jgi:hypothetical protein
VAGAAPPGVRRVGTQLDRVAGPGSRIVEVTINAAALGFHRRPAYVYLPPGYDLRANDHRRYPVVYLIHGNPGGAIDWMRAGAVRRSPSVSCAGTIPTGPGRPGCPAAASGRPSPSSWPT